MRSRLSRIGSRANPGRLPGGHTGDERELFQVTVGYNTPLTVPGTSSFAKTNIRFLRRLPRMPSILLFSFPSNLGLFFLTLRAPI